MSAPPLLRPAQDKVDVDGVVSTATDRLGYQQQKSHGIKRLGNCSAASLAGSEQPGDTIRDGWAAPDLGPPLLLILFPHQAHLGFAITAQGGRDAADVDRGGNALAVGGEHEIRRDIDGLIELDGHRVVPHVGRELETD